MSTAETALDLATRYRDAFFARDVDAIMALVTPDFVFENVTGGERIEGADAARRHISAIHARWADLTFDEPNGGLMAGAGHAVAEWTARATHPDTGQRIEWDGDGPDSGARRPHLPQRGVLVRARGPDAQ